MTILLKTSLRLIREGAVSFKTTETWNPLSSAPLSQKAEVICPSDLYGSRVVTTTLGENKPEVLEHNTHHI